MINYDRRHSFRKSHLTHPTSKRLCTAEKTSGHASNRGLEFELHPSKEITDRYGVLIGNKQ